MILMCFDSRLDFQGFSFLDNLWDDDDDDDDGMM